MARGVGLEFKLQYHTHKKDIDWLIGLENKHTQDIDWFIY
jgi:hypothetical protein